jgi:predicted phosphohydrolase
MTQTFSFDLISDLHVGDLDEFDWEGQPTSLYCIVAGDLAKDRAQLLDCLEHLGKRYKQVFYIDGNTEHKYYWNDMARSYRELEEDIAHIPNITFLNQRVCIANGLAIVGVNGWWTYDLDPNLDQEQAWLFALDQYKISESVGSMLLEYAYKDAHYLATTIERLQEHEEVNKILIVSHTVPMQELIKHDSELSDTYIFNLMGNSELAECLQLDKQNKITNWVFGHYHGRVDQAHYNIRFCNNPKGRANDVINDPYFPLRIEIEL